MCRGEFTKVLRNVLVGIASGTGRDLLHLGSSMLANCLV